MKALFLAALVATTPVVDAPQKSFSDITMSDVSKVCTQICAEKGQEFGGLFMASLVESAIQCVCREVSTK